MNKKMNKKNIKELYSSIALIGLALIVLVVVFYKIYYQQQRIPDNLDIKMISAVKETPVISKPQTDVKTLLIDITGSIKRPGVYRLKSGARLVDLIRDAGGVLPNADLTKINLASVLIDGTKIIIPFIGMSNDLNISADKNYNSDTKKNVESKININNATLLELENIPGIGKKYAGRIFELRKSSGRISSYEEIGKIKGVGPKRLDKIRAATVL